MFKFSEPLLAILNKRLSLIRLSNKIKIKGDHKNEDFAKTLGIKASKGVICSESKKTMNIATKAYGVHETTKQIISIRFLIVIFF